MAWLNIISTIIFVQFVMSMSFYYIDDPLPICSDYEMLIVNTQKCVSRCPITCNRGVCFENGTCPCDGSYLGSCKSGLICAADCVAGCKSAGGFCAAKNLCLCRKGYVFDAIQQSCRKKSHLFLTDKCKGQCLFGSCNYDGKCICAEGYVYRSNLLGQLCKPVCNSDCGPHAYCAFPNMCACRKKHYHYGPDGKCQKDIFY